MSDQATHKVDDDAYQTGRAAFLGGTTIRTIIEQKLVDPKDDPRSTSFAIGYADELIRHLRKPRGERT